MAVIGKMTKLLLFATEFAQDALTYARYCGISPFQDGRKRSFYKILIEAHALEKGLSLQMPRPLFGMAKIRFLMSALNSYDLSFSKLPAEMTCGVLEEYLKLHSRLGRQDPFLVQIEGFLSEYMAKNGIEPNGGLRKSDLAAEPSGGPALLTSRYSGRAFSAELIHRGEIEEVVRVAQSAPSQCNRQSTKVYFFQEKTRIDELLKLQGGSSGFSQDVYNLFIVSSELAAWGGAQQRNQAYVDGALFSMALLYSCHARGLVSCPLNLAISHKTERAVKRVAGISIDERLIMMVAVGKPMSADVRAARSPRRPLDEILVFPGDSKLTDLRK